MLRLYPTNRPKGGCWAPLLKVEGYIYLLPTPKRIKRQSPVLQGEGVYLGCLGRLEHFRCRQCGMDFNRKMSDPVVEDGSKEPGIGYMQGRGAA